MRACDPHGLGRNYWDFIKRYCGASKENQYRCERTSQLAPG